MSKNKKVESKLERKKRNKNKRVVNNLLNELLVGPAFYKTLDKHRSTYKTNTKGGFGL